MEFVDFLASAERQGGVQPQIPSEKAVLLALTSRVQLDKKPALSAFFSVRPFLLDEIVFFPNAFTACRCGECVACRLSGVASDYPTIRQGAGPARLTVRNAFPAGYEEVFEGKEPPEGLTVRRWWEMLGEGIGTELKSENFINRLTAKADPSTMERVPAGSEFQVEFVLDVYHLSGSNSQGDKELLEALAEAMKLLEHSALSGSGS